MAELPLLKISLEQIRELISLAEKVTADYKEIGMERGILLDALDHAGSANAIILFDLVESYSRDQRSEILALMLIGRGDERYNGKNWDEIFRRAFPLTEHANYITSKAPRLGGYLERGMQIVERSA